VKEKFCPKCGKKTDLLFDGLCEECLSEDANRVDIPRKVEVKVCRICGKKMRNEWKEENIEDTVKKSLEEERGLKKVEVVSDEDGSMEVEASMSVEGVTIEDSETVDVVEKKTVCENCKKASVGYFEAVVQIRFQDERAGEVLDTCRKIINSRSKGKPTVSKIEERKGGLDLYISSNSDAKYIARKLADRYRSERKNSKTLRGLVDGHKSYRSTYLIRILENGK